jgi:hypothetical protein
MRTSKRSRGDSSDICALYFNAPQPVGVWSGQSKRRYLPQVRLDSHTILSSLCYTTTLKQVFSNPSKEAVPQARYIFPLHDGVAVSGYTITYGDTTLRGKVQQKDVAKKTYEAAVEKGETAGLLESLLAGAFGVTLGNLPPLTDVHVKIVYCGELKHDAEIDGLRFMLPTSIAPRYGDYPGELLESTAASDSGISITVDVDMGNSAIRKLQSPSHPIAVSMGAISSDSAQQAFTPSKASTTLTLGTTELADDFIVQLLIDDISKPQVLVEKHPGLPSRAVVATLVPKFNLPPSHPEIVFIADQSGSMKGSKNDALVSALMVFVKSLPLGVRFNIIAFGRSVKALWPVSQAYSESSMKAAIDFIGTFKAQYGGTEILLPVKAAFEQMLDAMPLEVMLLTDGEIWGEQTLFDYINTQITENGADARVSALGIGNDVSHTLVEGVARAGNGFAQFVAEGEGTDRKVIRMLKGALYPHLKSRTLEVRYRKRETVEDDDFELIEKADHCLNIKDPQDDSVSSSATETAEKPMSFFDTTADLDKPIQPADLDRYAHLPTFDTPKIIQAPSEVPSLFPFNRTTIYLLLGPDAPQEPISSIIIRASSPQGPLELTIDVDEKEVVGTTVHQLAAKRAIQELEEGRGWLQSAKTSTGSLIKDEHKSRFDELIEREAVRLGEAFQVAGKWTSFVAVNEENSSRVEEEPEQPAYAGHAASHRHRSRGAMPAAPMSICMSASRSLVPRMPSAGGRRSSHRSGASKRSSSPDTLPPLPLPGYTANSYIPPAARSGSVAFGSTAAGFPLQEPQCQQAPQATGFYAPPAVGFGSAAFGSASAAPPAASFGGYTASRYAPSAGPSSSTLFGSAFAPLPPQATGFYAPPAGGFGSAAFGSASAAPPPPPSSSTASRYAPSAGGSGSALFGSASTGSAGAFGTQAFASAGTGPAMSHGPGVGIQPQYSMAPRARRSVKGTMNVTTTASKEEQEEDSDDDMGFGLFDDAPAGPKPTTPVSPLHSLINLQTFSGAWEWRIDLLAVVVPQGKKLEFDAAFGSEQVLATCLAVAYMEARLTDSKDIWEMVVEKAKVWMGSQVGEDVVDGLVEKAKGLL